MTEDTYTDGNRVEIGSTITVARYGGRRFIVEETDGETDSRLLLRPQELRSMPTPRLVSRGALRTAQIRGNVEVVQPA